MNSFLEALKARCTVYELNGGRDWRLGRDEDQDATDAEKAIAATSKRRTWFGWGDEERQAFEQAVEAVTGGRQGEQQKRGRCVVEKDIDPRLGFETRLQDVGQCLRAKSQSPLGR